MYLFYRSFWGISFLVPLGILDYKGLEKEMEEKKKTQFLVQFKDMIQSMASALNAGYSAENAIREAQKEMKLLYAEEEMIQQELTVMVRQMRVQIPMEQVFDDLAQRVKLEDVGAICLRLFRILLVR